MAVPSSSRTAEEWRVWAREAPSSALQAFLDARKGRHGGAFGVVDPDDPLIDAVDVILDELVRRINRNQEQNRASHQP